MTLYVFGDSFSHPFSHFEDSNNLRKTQKEFPEFISIEHNWVDIVAKELTGSYEDQVNLSMAGCANEYIFHHFMHQMPNIKDGDYVIVCFTSENRRWLVERCPHLSNWANSKIDPNIEGSVTKSEHKAIQQYAKYLHSSIAANAIYNSIIWSCVHAATNLEPLGVKVLLLPGFHEIAGVHGTLTEASFREFDTTETRDKFYKKTNDSRWNHFTEENHKILANKVCKFFKDFEPVDLNTEFKTGVFNKENI